MASPKRISFVVTQDELATVKAYCEEKRRWKDPAALARDALWQHIARNPLSRLQEARVEEGRGGGMETGHAVLRGASEGKE